MKQRLCSALFCAILLVALTTPSACANSAQTYWSGVSPTGILITDGDCPIVVEHERLTFDIQEFPQGYYYAQNDYQAYSAGVAAQYTFYNPADYTVTATLLFPFGNEPDYASSTPHSDTGKFGVTVNGEAIDAALGHSYSPHSEFDLEEDLALLHDSYAEDAFYTPDLPVTHYTYTISADTSHGRSVTAAFDWTAQAGTRLYFPGQTGYNRLDSGAVRMEAHGMNQTTLDLYVIGSQLSEPPQWTLTENGEAREGSVLLKHTETMTFRDLALAGWSETSAVSETDWYNAVVAAFDFYEQFYGFGLVGFEDGGPDLTGDLMRWYEYEITLSPGARITNTVTAPMYPAINGSYDPPIYKYTYLLSPARTWTRFGTLEIQVNTPYCMTDSNQGSFAETDAGYALTLDGLPDGELEFTLCADKNPKKQTSAWSYLPLILIAVFALPAIAVLLILIKIIRRIKQRRS